jgi:hypothetical protein
MARTPADLSGDTRITDYISLGVVTKFIPLRTVNSVLGSVQKLSQRERDLPAHVVVYYVIALGLYMQVAYREVLRCLLEGIQWLVNPSEPLRVAGKSGISQARTRLGWEPLQQLHEQVVGPVASPQTKGAWYRGWRLVTLDGSILDVADERDNARAFGRPGASRGKAAYPQVRFVSLVENGTHVLFGSRLGAYATGETTLARQVVPRLSKGMLCLADRNFFSYRLWQQAAATGASLLWRVKKNMRLDCEKRLPDGSYLSRVYPGERDYRHKTNGILVRVTDYEMREVAGAESVYRLLTTIIDPAKAPAPELARLYHERWEVETALDELKTHLRGSHIVLRSKTPNLVRQEFYGLMMAHFAVRNLMHEAAMKAGEDPDRLSFIHSVRVVRRKMTAYVVIPPSAEESIS